MLGFRTGYISLDLYEGSFKEAPFTEATVDLAPPSVHTFLLSYFVFLLEHDATRRTMNVSHACRACQTPSTRHQTNLAQSLQ